MTAPGEARAPAGVPTVAGAGRGEVLDVLRRNRVAGSIGVLLALIAFNAVFTENFLTQQTLNVNLTQATTTVIVAVGMTLVIATGGIDLSVGSLMAISGSLAALIILSDAGIFANHALSVALAFVLPVLATAACGFFNGSLVTFFRIQPIIATLVLYLAGRGIAQALLGGELKTFRDPDFQYIGNGEILGVRFQVLLMLAIVAGFAWVMRATTFGRYVLATGGNEAAARLAGVPVGRVKLAVYTISGLLAGIPGLIVISLNSSTDPSAVGNLVELDAIAAVAVGGTPLTGGRASIVGTFLGALIIQLLRFSLISNNVPEGIARTVIAGAIIGAVLLQRGRD